MANGARWTCRVRSDSAATAGDDKPVNLISTVLFAAAVWVSSTCVWTGVHLLQAVNEKEKQKKVAVSNIQQLHRLHMLRTCCFYPTAKKER